VIQGPALLRLLLLFAALPTIGCAALAKVEEPAFATRIREGAFEVRHYGARVVATTDVEGPWSRAGSEGFRRLAGYIFGKNRARSEIAMTAPVSQRGTTLPMTAPVSQRGAGQRWTVSFAMPAGASLASLPIPDDPRVILEELPPTDVAVVVFSGRWTEANMQEHTVELRRWVERRGLRLAGEAEVNRYDSPFTLWFLRRNEIAFPVHQSTPLSSTATADGSSASPSR
jgi:hypothetical protein